MLFVPVIRRSALVEHSAARMYALVNDVAAYSRRFGWCEGSQVLEEGVNEDGTGRMVARLDIGFGALRTWFTTENTTCAPHHSATIIPPLPQWGSGGEGVSGLLPRKSY